MVFDSFAYALFLPTVLALYWALRGHRRQNVLLLVASYVFYGAWDWRFLGLMWLTTAVDYAVGRRLAATVDDGARRRILAASLVVNLGVLAAFKYFGFFVDSFVDLASRAGLDATGPGWELLLPIGISFYTFHGISYTVDVYRREIEAVRDPITFGVFVAYFPQLVAGPIGRAQVQLPQFANDRSRPSAARIRSALGLILLGLFKKVVIADGLAGFVDEAFARSDAASAPTLLLGAYGFALQIYGDFSGYTDIARGSSRLFGIELLRNFEQPYLSRDVRAFWRRWHISLSTWLRDYLYVPLGGNRRGHARTRINLLTTMVLGGLWHGASWTFVAWGAVHGLLLVAHDLRSERAGPRAVRPPRWRRFLQIAITFHLVTAAWILFRADSIGDAIDHALGIVTLRGGAIDWSLAAMVVFAGVAIAAIDRAQVQRRSEDLFSPMRAPASGALVAALTFVIVLFSGGGGAPFIYFQF